MHLQPEGDEPRRVVKTFELGVLADVVADFSRFGVEDLAEKKLFEQLQRFFHFIVVFPLEASRDEQSHAEPFAAGIVVGIRIVEIRRVFFAVVDQIRAAERAARVGHLLLADDEADPAVDNRFQIFRNKSVRTEDTSVDPEFKLVFSGFLRRIIDKNGTVFDAERNFVSVAENFRRFRFCAAFRRDAEPFIRKDGFLFK